MRGWRKATLPAFALHLCVCVLTEVRCMNGTRVGRQVAEDGYSRQVNPSLYIQIPAMIPVTCAHHWKLQILNRPQANAPRLIKFTFPRSLRKEVNRSHNGNIPGPRVYPRSQNPLSSYKNFSPKNFVKTPKRILLGNYLIIR